MIKTTGHAAIVEQLLADGMDYMFGNPGTVEQGFLDAMTSYPDMTYILTLQETIAVMAADGYARATQRPALVQLHSTPGVGNAVGALYQAYRGHSPLVVIGGDAGIKYQAMDAQMAGDLVAMAKPVTKWATMVVEPSSLLRVLRRAVKIAGTPPMGPVYVCMPQDILDAEVVENVQPTFIPSTQVSPDATLIREAASVLAAAQKPMIFVGDGVAYSGAQDALTRVAELLGAEVWDADAGEVNMSYAHPLYQGMTGHMFGHQSYPITSKGDVNLICGTYMLPEVFPELGAIFAAQAKVIHFDLNLDEIAKNHPVDIGGLGDPKLTLDQLANVLETIMTPDQRAAARVRRTQLERARTATLAQTQAQEIVRPTGAVQMTQFMEELALVVPDDVIIFDEALTNSPPISRSISPTKIGHYFLTRGGSLGVGIPGAIGAKLANPDKLVIGFSGDGGSMYTFQSLWTAARYNINIKAVICNNASYQLLRFNINTYWKERDIPAHAYPPSFDLSDPPLHFADMARSMGVQAVRVEQAREIRPAIEQALHHEGPFLIDLVLAG